MPQKLHFSLLVLKTIQTNTNEINANMGDVTKCVFLHLMLHVDLVTAKFNSLQIRGGTIIKFIAII